MVNIILFLVRSNSSRKPYTLNYYVISLLFLTILSNQGLPDTQRNVGYFQKF